MTSPPIELSYRGRDVVVVKREVHQWRTDLVLQLDGREYTIGRMESAMTRGEVKTLARQWLEEHPPR